MNISNTLPFSVETVRRDFPVLRENVHGKSLVYLDNGATTQKPQQVIDAISDYYSRYNSNVHRGVHHLSQLATDAYEAARRRIAHFINAAADREIIFTKGTTEAINLVASTYGAQHLQAGDTVLLTHMEHHANIVPWQMLCQAKGAQLQVLPLNEDATLCLDHLQHYINERTKIVAITYLSNVTGIINPLQNIIAKAHEVGAVVVVDAAQAVAHFPVDVQALQCDFLCFSGHKLYAPTGIGVLWGRADLLEQMPPYQLGGAMIQEVTFERTTFNDIPFRFEAGTPDIAGAIGLDAAIAYLQQFDFRQLEHHEQSLLQAATEQLQAIENLTVYGAAAPLRSGVLSFNLKGAHPYDVGVLLDQMGIACRTGHHCCQPLMRWWGIEGTVRASFALYNTLDEVSRLAEGIQKAARILA